MVEEGRLTRLEEELRQVQVRAVLDVSTESVEHEPVQMECSTQCLDYVHAYMDRSHLGFLKFGSQPRSKHSRTTTTVIQRSLQSKMAEPAHKVQFNHVKC